MYIYSMSIAPDTKSVSARQVPAQAFDSCRPYAIRKGYGNSNSDIVRCAIACLDSLLRRGIDPDTLQPLETAGAPSCATS